MKNKGISLIVLVVTIIVIIILAGAVILSLTQNNPINESNEAKFKIDAKSYTSEIMLYVSKQYVMSNGSYDIKTLNKDSSSLKDVVISMKDEDKEKFEIQKGELVYIKNKCNTDEIAWCQEIGIKEKDSSIIKIFNVNKPKLVAGMTAVKWDGNAWINVANPEVDTSWYDYVAQAGNTDGQTSKWANAKTADGSMWVWIPRYAYKIAYSGSSVISEIDIKFLYGITNNIDDKETVLDSTYTVHPVFTNNIALGGWDKELEGIWVAKYEAGYAVTAQGDTQVLSNEVYTSDTTVNYYGEVTSGSTKITYPVYKANRYSSNYMNIGDAYKIAKAMTSVGNPYGLTSSADTHMMKNSEWGAVAYLAHSKYGRNGKDITVNSTNANNTPSTIYGITAGGNGINGLATDEKTAITNNKLQSTTGNEYGIYDLSGGNWERTAGYINNGSEALKMYGQNILDDGGAGNSTKHKTVYAYDSEVDQCQNNYIKLPNPSRKGESIWETSSNGNASNTGWFGDYSNFVHTSFTWFMRGGNYMSNRYAGTFGFYNTVGGSYISAGFRAVLVAL